jgi:hypothetical protein
MSKCAFNYLSGWDPRLRLGRPTSVLVIKCTTLPTCIENSYQNASGNVIFLMNIVQISNINDSPPVDSCWLNNKFPHKPVSM